MRTGNRSALTMMVMVMCMAFAGCHEHSTARYSMDAHNIVQILHPGDTLEWPAGFKPKWEGDSPCDGSDTARCTIAAGMAGYPFKYSCPDGSCDPEIAVDDPGVGMNGQSAGGPRVMRSSIRPGAVPQVVYLRCDASGNLLTPDTPTSVDDQIQWGKLGLHVKDGWTVTFADDTTCKEGKVFDVNGTCTVKAQNSYPTTVKYTVAGLCTTTPPPGHDASTITISGTTMPSPKK